MGNKSTKDTSLKSVYNHKTHKFVLVGCPRSGKSQTLQTLQYGFDSFKTNDSVIQPLFDHFTTLLAGAPILIGPYYIHYGRNQAVEQFMNMDKKTKLKLLNDIRFQVIESQLKVFNIDPAEVLSILIEHARFVHNECYHTLAKEQLEILKRFSLVYEVQREKMRNLSHMIDNRYLKLFVPENIGQVSSENEIAFVYIPLTGFVDRNHDESQTMFEKMEKYNMIEKIVNLPNKKFIFIFTKPDVLYYLITNGLASYNKPLKSKCRPELSKVRNEVKLIISSIIDNVQKEFKEVSNADFQYHIMRTTVLAEVNTIFTRTVEDYYKCFISKSISQELRFESCLNSPNFSDVIFLSFRSN